MVNMAKTPLGKVVEGMINAPSPKPEEGWTLGWDVVVSYSEEEINQNLARSWEKHRNEMVEEIKVSTTVEKQYDDFDDDDSDPVTRDIVMKFGAPKIQFASGTASPTVNLILPVRQGSSKLSTKPSAFEFPEDTYQISLKNIPLGMVKGDYYEIQANNRSGSLPPPIEGDKECRFESKLPDNARDDFEVSWVVLAFSLKEGDLQVAAEMAPGHELDSTRAPNEKAKRRINAGREGVETAAKVFFVGTRATDFQSTFNVLRHALATIKDKQHSQQGPVHPNLTPRKFRMAVLQGSTVKPILSLFIHVVDGVDEGEINDLQMRWAGIWLNAKVAPIPSTHTASILIHPQLIYKNLLSNSLVQEANKGWVFEPLIGKKGGGIAVEAKFTETLSVPQIFVERFPSKGEITSSTVDPWSEDLKNIGATVHLRQRDMDQRPVIYINWEFSTTTRRNDWHGRKMNPYNYSTVAGRISKWKTTLKLDHDIPLRINSTDYDITLEADTEQLAQSWQFSEEELSVDFADKVHNLATKSFFADEDMTRAVVAQTKEELRKNIPTLTFGEMGLGFFLTTNLLNPGAKVIRIDEKVGFRVPGNLLLVGHVVQGQDNIKSGKI